MKRNSEGKDFVSKMQTRRRFLATLSSAGAAGLMGAGRSSAQEGPPETTTVRLSKNASICVAPQFVSEELLHAEGFTDVRFVEVPLELMASQLARGAVDFASAFSPQYLVTIDGGAPITIVGGLHIGCFELFAREGIRSIPDLKGKTVGVRSIGSPAHLFVSTMAAHVGLDPRKDIRWVAEASPQPMELFAVGQIDAFLGFPPEPQDLRARGIGRVIVNSVTDRPWSQYFCCMVATHGDYARRNPIATKRVLRALAKSADLCVTQPERVAQHLVDGGYTPRYDFALQSIKAIPYANWRHYNAEDTIRFYALRLHEAGMIKTTPNKIIARAADFRFFNELRRELKA
jgi:NitT/TauT family transport system substrate-binding protein